MAEVLVLLSAVQASTQLVEQALRIFGRLRKAHQRQKALVDVLLRHERELGSVKRIIGVIDDEEELQTASVAADLVRLKEVQCKLVSRLEELDPKPKARGKLDGFVRQLVQGSSEEKKLHIVMEELSHVKAALLVSIQVANVGVMRTMEKQLVANAEVIQRVDEYLREEVGYCEGLRIARILKGRRPSDDGTVPLTPADLHSLSQQDDGEYSSDETVVDDSELPERQEVPVKTERIILRNTSRHQALQINAALGKDIWKDMERLVIKDNIAENESVQVNHGTTLQAALILLDRQDARIFAARQQVGKT